MASYKDVTRGKFQYSGDHFLELHRQHARKVTYNLARAKGRESSQMKDNPQLHTSSNTKRRSPELRDPNSRTDPRSDIRGHQPRNPRRVNQQTAWRSTLTPLLNILSVTKGEVRPRITTEIGLAC